MLINKQNESTLLFEVNTKFIRKIKCNLLIQIHDIQYIIMMYI